MSTYFTDAASDQRMIFMITLDQNWSHVTILGDSIWIASNQTHIESRVMNHKRI